MKNILKNIFDDKVFFKKLMVLVIPIILQELLNSSVNLIDTFMIGQLGEVPVTSVGLANQIFFLFNFILFGVNSGSIIFIAQYWGKKDLNSIYKVMGISIIISTLIASIFCFGALFFPKVLMKIYSKDELVILEGVKYLKVIGLSYFLVAFIMWNNASLKAINLTKYPMITTFISLVTNIILNYIFIFVLNYGVVGAAYATFCSRIVEIFSQLLILFFIKAPIIAKIKEYFSFDKPFLKNYFKVATPVIINEVLWAFGTTIYNIAYKFSGTEAQAAVQITSTLEKLFIVFGVGVGAGCGIILSNTLGSGEIEKAKEYSKKCLVLSAFLSLFMGVILLNISPLIVNFFNVEEVVKSYARKLLIVVSIGMIFKTYNYTSIVGILRSGGDTKWALFIDFSSVWFVGVPMAFLGSYFLGLPIYFTYAMVYFEEFVKYFVSSYRVKKNVWAKSLV